MDAKIKQQFKEIHNLDVDTLDGKLVCFTCRKFNSGEKVRFIGKVKADYLYLAVEYPYNIDKKICDCAETGVSPNVIDPHAYYIFEDCRFPKDRESDEWAHRTYQFRVDYEKYKEQEKYKEMALHACRTVLDGIIDSKFDMSVDWEKIFLGAYNDYDKTGNKG